MTDDAHETLEDLVADGAERVDREGPSALDALCGEHPQYAAELRAALLPLIRFGLVGPTAPTAPSTATPVLEPPRWLGEFEIVREIGRGGMGVVYEARQSSLDRLVAVKVLPPRWVQDPRQVTRFQNEARAAATLDHPGIVPVYFVGEQDGTHYYAMQRIDGVSLRSLLDHLATDEPDARAHEILGHLLPASTAGQRLTGGDAPWQRAANLAAQAAVALSKAHGVGILHRDVKPGNLLIDREGRLWITDFGLAHFVREESDLTRSGEFIGTLAYGSPEQLTGEFAVDARSDVYSLGATFYEMLTLRPPFTGSAAVVAQLVATAEPPPPRAIDASIPRDLETIVLRAMAKEPHRRYQSAAALAADLSAFLTGQPIAARRVTASERTLRWCRRNRVLAGSLAGLALLALVLVAVTFTALRIAGERDRVVQAESALTRESSLRRIEGCVEAARVLRQGLTAGRRVGSIALLREATAAVDTAAADAAERAQLLCRLRTEVIASLGSWDATTETLFAADASATPLAFDRTFTWCALRRGSEVLVEDRDRRTLGRLPMLGNHVLAWFAPNPDWLVLTDVTTVRLWNWRTGRLLVPPGARGERAFCSVGMSTVFVVLDGTRVVACDLAAGTFRNAMADVQQDLVDAGGQVNVIAVNDTGDRLAVGQVGANRLLVANLTTGATPIVVALPDDPWQVVFESDGRHAVVSGRFLDLLRLDLDRQLVVGTWSGHHAEVPVLSADATGTLLASVGWDSQVRLWKHTGEALLSLPTSTTPREALFSSGGRLLGWAPTDGDRGAARAWRLHPPAVLRETALAPRAHTGLPDVVFHPNLPLLALAMRECVLFLDPVTHAPLGELRVDAPRRVRFLADGRLFVESGDERGACVAPVEPVAAGEVRIGPLRPLDAARGALSCDIAGNFIGVFDGNSVRVLDGERIVRTWPAAVPDAVHLRLSHDARFAALGAFPGGTHAAVWDLRTGRKQLEVPVWQSTAFAAFSPDGSKAAIARRDAHIVYSSDTWRELATIRRPQPAAACGTCGWSPDGSLLAVPMSRSRIAVIDTSTFTPLLELDVPDGATANEPAFSPEGGSLLLVSIHRKLFAWDLRAARAELFTLGLDWDGKPIPAPPTPSTPLRLQIVE